MLTDEHIDILRAHIHREGEIWVTEYVQRRKAQLLRDNVKASAALINSMEFALTQVTNSAITNTIELAFAEHGRFVDMKLRPAGGGEEYLQQLAEWIVEKNLYDKFVQRYIQSRNLRNPPKNVLQNLAWATAKKRAAKTPRRRRWYAASSTAAVTDLFNRVAEGMPDIIINALKKNLTDGSKTR
jgi:hypothetical protein